MTEDELRRIIREEIRAALEVLSAEAAALPSYETDRIDDAAAYMIERAADGAIETLKHAPDCARRAERGWRLCDCGKSGD
ncbi:hypothetical protein ABT264_19375 [Streptomyces virginiae]|uniref:hypothetical protein n=1 Tax=Streptomyces virginiae TaxID=1961 RepID=UPI0033303DE3